MEELEGNVVDVRNNRIYSGRLGIMNGLIEFVEETGAECDHYLSPGFIDAHIHIESSMLCPSRFAEAVVPHGTTAVVTDPHEIANVMGVPGIDYMIKDASGVPLNVYFTAPSCVPATPFETAGAEIGAKEIEALLARPEVVALGEMMNYPGVINEVPEVMAKLEAAKAAGKPVDGHAPMLSGPELKRYIDAGISTDHECTTADEAREKAKLGMRIMLREGSASKNLKALAPVAMEFDDCFLVSDDKHPEDLSGGHINAILRTAVDAGIEPLRAIRMVTLNPSEHYKLGRGVLEKGKPADIVEFDNLKNFNVNRVFIDGKMVAGSGSCRFPTHPLQTTSTIPIARKKTEEFQIKVPLETGEEARVRIIEVIPDNIITKERIETMKVEDGLLNTDPENDILKLAVINRYGDTPAAAAFIRGFGLKKGAICASVAHDSHNIIAVGADDTTLSRVVNRVIGNEGGFAVTDTTGDEILSLELPISGLMSPESADAVAGKLRTLQEKTRELGSELASPFLTLSFMALLVIPELKLSDKGLFDGRSFKFVDIIIK